MGTIFFTVESIPPTDLEDFEDLDVFGNSSTENSAGSCLAFGMAKKQQFSGRFWNLPQRQLLSLWALRANQHHRHFASGFIKLRHKPQLIGVARQTSHRELAKRAFAGRLWRLIILSALKTAGGIHGDSLCRKVGQSLSMLGQFRNLPVFHPRQYHRQHDRTGRVENCTRSSILSLQSFLVSLCWLT